MPEPPTQPPDDAAVAAWAAETSALITGPLVEITDTLIARAVRRDRARIERSVRRDARHLWDGRHAIAAVPLVDITQLMKAPVRGVSAGSRHATAVVHDPTNDWCACEPDGSERCEYRMLADTVREHLNPADKDEAEVSIHMDAVKAIAEFVGSMPCECLDNPPEYAESEVPDGPDVVCGRCGVLGQYKGKAYSR